MEPQPPALGAWSFRLSHWTTREVPVVNFKNNESATGIEIDFFFFFLLFKSFLFFFSFIYLATLGLSCIMQDLLLKCIDSGCGWWA